MTINQALTKIKHQLIKLDELELAFKGYPDKLVEVAESRARVLATLSKIETLLARLSGDNLDGSLN